MSLENLFKSISNAAEDFKKGFAESGSSSSTRSSNVSYYKSSGSGTSSSSNRVRRTDDDLSKNRSGMDRSPSSFQVKKGVSLSAAKNSANSEPGVYILYLNGSVMKCGRAAYGQGVRWRFTQYYNLNYDNRARMGDCWSVSKSNRDQVTVSWQCCPEAACKELEYKLFEKYGKGPWAERGPARCDSDDWELLI